MASSPGPEKELAEAMDESEPKPVVANIGQPDVTPGVKDFSLSVTGLLTKITDENCEFAFKKPYHVIVKEKAAEKALEETSKEDSGFELMDIPKKEPETSPFVEAAIKASQRSRTENDAPTFSTAGDARVDFFFNAMEQSTADDTVLLISKSWDENKLDTLKVLANLRDIRGGKGIRRQYQDCLYWLYQNHPKTLYENLPELIKFGYWKDVLHLLVIVCFDGFVHPFLSSDDKPRADLSKLKGKKLKERRMNSDREKRLYNKIIAQHYGLIKENKNVDSVSKAEMDKSRFKFAREKFTKDVKYRVFHVRVARVFAQQLHEDMQIWKDSSKKKKEISLAGKWAPSLEGHFDRYTLIASTIAIELASLAGRLQMNKTDRVAVYLARKMYHKEYCVPFRKYTEVPEVHMSADEWGQVKYNRVPARSMQKNKSLFMKHDKERFEKYVKDPNSKIAGASLKPVDLICSIMSLESADEIKRAVVEKQWISLAEDIKKKGGSSLSSAIAVCDVSGSMEGIPMQAAIGLTLLTMNMTDAPWNSVCITFHESPTIFHLKETMTLTEKVAAMKAMPWGGNTALHKVFEEILNLGLKNKLNAEQMPKMLLIFTDMEFDHACPGTDLTNFEAAKILFEKSGYTLPTIIFWNLRGASGKKTTPVQKNELGVILLSGWSGQLLAQIMGQTEELLKKCTPLSFLLEVLQQTKYDNLKIYD